MHLEQFKNFDRKPKGGPEASLAHAKGGPQGNFKKFKNSFKPFKTLQESYKTNFLMKTLISDQ